MIIGGITKLSTIDWPGKVTAVIFTRGCNFRCPWCQNKALLTLDGPAIPEQEAIFFLRSRRKYLDGVVVTGGEPSIQADLADFLRRIKALGLPVKLDTNGSNPDVLKKLLDEKLVDALAIDIKAPFEKYAEAAGVPVDISAIRRSFETAVRSGLSVWFRTTVVPRLIGPIEKQVILDYVTNMGKGLIQHVLQEYRQTSTLL